MVDVFENQTGDPSLDPVGNMLQDWLTDGLLRSDLIEVVPTMTARHAAKMVASGIATGDVRDPVAALAAEANADIVVTGALYRDGDELRIRTSVTEGAGTEEPRELASIAPVTGPAYDLGGLVDRARDNLLGALGTRMNLRLQAQIGATDRAPRFEAYQIFDQGLERYASRDYRDASELFLRAFELDTTYAVPLLYASLSLRNHRAYAESDSVVEILEARRDEFSEYERHWIAYSRAVLAGDLDGARITIRQAAALAPGSKASYKLGVDGPAHGAPRGSAGGARPARSGSRRHAGRFTLLDASARGVPPPRRPRAGARAARGAREALPGGAIALLLPRACAGGARLDREPQGGLRGGVRVTLSARGRRRSLLRRLGGALRARPSRGGQGVCRDRDRVDRFTDDRAGAPELLHGRHRPQGAAGARLSEGSAPRARGVTEPRPWPSSSACTNSVPTPGS